MIKKFETNRIAKVWLTLPSQAQNFALWSFASQITSHTAQKSFTVWMIWEMKFTEYIKNDSHCESFSCSWVRHRRNRVHFPKRTQNVSRSFRRSGPVVDF